MRLASRLTGAVTSSDTDSLVGTSETKGTGSSVPVRSKMGDSRGDLATGAVADGGMSSVESNCAKKSCKS